MAKKRTTRKTKSDLSFIAEPLRALAIPLDEIDEDPRNARRHGEKNIAAIAASLRRFGQLKPAVGNRTTGQLEAGHGMLAAARQLQWSHLAVVWVEHSEADARDFGLADNRTAELAEWDEVMVAELLAELRAEDGGEEFADELLLAELTSELLPQATAGQDDLPEAGDAETIEIEQKWGVVVIVDDEDQQKVLLQEMEERGHRCRALL